MEKQVAGGAALEEVPTREDRRPDDENADHVCGERIHYRFHAAARSRYAATAAGFFHLIQAWQGASGRASGAGLDFEPARPIPSSLGGAGGSVVTN